MNVLNPNNSFGGLYNINGFNSLPPLFSTGISPSALAQSQLLTDKTHLSPALHEGYEGFQNPAIANLMDFNKLFGAGSIPGFGGSFYPLASLFGNSASLYDLQKLLMLMYAMQGSTGYNGFPASPQTNGFGNTLFPGLDMGAGTNNFSQPAFTPSSAAPFQPFSSGGTPTSAPPSAPTAAPSSATPSSGSAPAAQPMASTPSPAGAAQTGTQQAPPETIIVSGDQLPSLPTTRGTGADSVALAEKLLGMKSDDNLKSFLPTFQNVGNGDRNCADFVSSILQSTGRLEGHKGNCTDLMNLMEKEGWSFVRGKDIQPGDVYFEMRWDPEKNKYIAKHVELVTGPYSGRDNLIGSNNIPLNSPQNISRDTLWDDYYDMGIEGREDHPSYGVFMHIDDPPATTETTGKGDQTNTTQQTDKAPGAPASKPADKATGASNRNKNGRKTNKSSSISNAQAV